MPVGVGTAATGGALGVIVAVTAEGLVDGNGVNGLDSYVMTKGREAFSTQPFG